MDKISFNEGLQTSKGDILASGNSRTKEVTSISRDIKALETKIRRTKGQPFQEARRLFLELESLHGFQPVQPAETSDLNPESLPPTPPLFHSRPGPGPCAPAQGLPEGS